MTDLAQFFLLLKNYWYIVHSVASVWSQCVFGRKLVIIYQISFCWAKTELAFYFCERWCYLRLENFLPYQWKPRQKSHLRPLVQFSPLIHLSSSSFLRGKFRILLCVIFCVYPVDCDTDARKAWPNLYSISLRMQIHFFGQCKLFVISAF